MAQTFATPGVYIEERSAFPNSVAAIPTAIPAFVGFTHKADRAGNDLTKKPTRVTSMAEFESLFGTAPDYRFNIVDGAPEPGKHDFKVKGNPYKIEQTPESEKLLYNAIRFFYANGGGTCYIVSVGDHKTAKDDMKGKLLEGIAELVKSTEPTMLLVPEARLLGASYDVEQQMLQHCGGTMKSRFAIMDVHDGDTERTYDDNDVITKFREGVGSNFLDFGAAYYPWVQTSIVSESELSFLNIASTDKLLELLKADAGDEKNESLSEKEKGNIIKLKAEIDKVSAAKAPTNDAEAKSLKQLNQLLMASCPSLKIVISAACKKLNLMAPAAAMAGIYSMTDNNRGVWKAPANVSLSSVVAPSVLLSNSDQEDLNITLSGKSVNAIRSFTGEGIIVWGGRTLDGNSQDWRYINVRRTMIYIEQSVKAAAKAYVFEPNESKTWVAVKSMISNFLNDVWKQGGLAGASPEDAFSVEVGLGSTMTPVDILDGFMRISVKVAITRPAEFIVITFEQQMQQS